MAQMCPVVTGPSDPATLCVDDHASPIFSPAVAIGLIATIPLIGWSTCPSSWPAGQGGGSAQHCRGLVSKMIPRTRRRLNSDHTGWPHRIHSSGCAASARSTRGTYRHGSLLRRLALARTTQAPYASASGNRVWRRPLADQAWCQRG